MKITETGFVSLLVHLSNTKSRTSEPTSRLVTFVWVHALRETTFIRIQVGTVPRFRPWVDEMSRSPSLDASKVWSFSWAHKISGSSLAVSFDLCRMQKCLLPFFYPNVQCISSVSLSTSKNAPYPRFLRLQTASSPFQNTFPLSETFCYSTNFAICL